MTDAERDEWARTDALAAVREDLDYIGIDYDRLLSRGYPREGVVGDWTFDTWPTASPARCEAARLARLFASNHQAFQRETGRAGLGLAGETGRGKTGLVIAMGWVLTGRGCSYGTGDSLFTTWRALMRQCYDVLGRSPSGRGALVVPSSVGTVIRRYVEAEILVLDDLGDPVGTSASPFARQVLQEIIWPRYDRGLPTVITTNLDGDELETQFGAAAVSRLHGMAKWVEIDGDDERRQRRAA